MIRVRLPNPAGYASCPSGDTEYEDAYLKALGDATPPGFEVIDPRLGQRWAVDSEGFTLVPLRCTDREEALSHYMVRCQELQTKLDQVRKVVR